MRLHAEHRFPASIDAVVAAMVDPGFVAGLTALPDVGAVEVVDGGGTATRPWLATRMIYDGSLDPIAARVLGSSSPSWVQTYRLDATTGTGTLEIAPEHHGSLLRCRADLRFTADDAGHPDDRNDADDTAARTRRTLDGELSIRVPLIGSRAERSLGPAIVARIDVEADLLEDWLRRSS